MHVIKYRPGNMLNRNPYKDIFCRFVIVRCRMALSLFSFLNLVFSSSATSITTLPITKTHQWRGKSIHHAYERLVDTRAVGWRALISPLTTEYSHSHNPKTKRLISFD